MNHQILHHEHPIEGLIEISEKPGGVVQLNCHWPLDLDTDEWFELGATFTLSDYSRAIDEAAVVGSAAAVAQDGESIVFTPSPAENVTSVEISNASSGWANRSLRLNIQKPLAEFAATAV